MNIIADYQVQAKTISPDKPANNGRFDPLPAASVETPAEDSVSPEPWFMIPSTSAGDPSTQAFIAGDPSDQIPNAPKRPDWLDPARETKQIKQIAAWLRLFVEPGQVVELRALSVSTLEYRKFHTETGFFDYQNLNAMAEKAYRLTFDAQGIYFTINPLKADLLARRSNRVEAASEGMASDGDVAGRKRLLVDADPVRISGVSASDEEKAKSREVILRVREFLRGLQWPEPIFADSGNGFHLLYDIDLPGADGEVVKQVLEALAAKFDTEAVKIDTSVFNPSRIAKLYGTLARKGDDIPQRPHRWASILEVPQERRPVPKEMLERLAKSAPTKNAPNTNLVTARLPDLRLAPQAQDGLLNRARNYLDKVPGANSGAGGHNKTFATANVLVRGFGLSTQDALPIFKEWNAKCQPPWNDKDLIYKLEEAAKADGPRGYLLGQAAGAGNAGPSRIVVASGFKADFINSATFAGLNIQNEWLIQRVLVANQPAVVGGPKKALKTSLMIDLAVSLGGGRSFLSYFDVPRRLRVLVLSGESGQAAIQSTARRVCQMKGVDLAQCDIFWGFRLPRLSSEADLAELAKGILENGIEAVVIDPLYLCLLAGNAGLQAGNVYQMGPLLLGVAQACLDAGATPILVHHTTKMGQFGKGFESYEPLDLDNLAFAGIAEFARQWMILSRRERFDPESGEHKLWLNVGGSAGHSGLYGVDIREGILNERFGGRTWNVAVESATNVRAATERAKRQQKEADKRIRDEDDDEKVRRVLRMHPEGETAKVIGDESGVGKRALGVLLGLLKRLDVVCTNVVKPCGRNKAMPFKGWRLWREGERRPVTHDEANRLRQGETIETVGNFLLAKAAGPRQDGSDDDIEGGQDGVSQMED